MALMNFIPMVVSLRLVTMAQLDAQEVRMVERVEDLSSWKLGMSFTLMVP